MTPRRKVEVVQRRTVERGGGVDEDVLRAEARRDLAHRRLIAKIHREFPGSVEDRDVVPGIRQSADDRAPYIRW